MSMVALIVNPSQKKTLTIKARLQASIKLLVKPLKCLILLFMTRRITCRFINRRHNAQVKPTLNSKRSIRRLVIDYEPEQLDATERLIQLDSPGQS
jgi:hypothetical protein